MNADDWVLDLEDETEPEPDSRFDGPVEIVASPLPWDFTRDDG